VFNESLSILIRRTRLLQQQTSDGQFGHSRNSDTLLWLVNINRRMVSQAKSAYLAKQDAWQTSSLHRN